MWRADGLRRARIGPTCAVIAATVATMTSFDLVFRGWQWLYLSAAITCIVLVTAAILRGLGRSSTWVAAGSFMASFFALMWFFASSSAFLHVLPTAATLDEFGRLGGEAMRRFAENEAPLTVTEPDLFVMGALAAVVALFADLVTVGRKAPAAGGLIFVGVFLTPTVAAGLRPSVWVFVAIAIPWLYLLHAGTLRSGKQPIERAAGRSRLPAMGIAALALAAALVIPPAMPASTSLGISWGSGPRGAFDSGINPMLALGENLRQGSEVKVLEYATDSNQPLYLKVTNLHDFTGKTWAPGPSVMRSEDSDALEGRAALQPGIVRRNISTDINILGLNASYLPMPYPAQEVNGLAGRWRWQSDGRNFESSTANTRGQSYSVTSLQVSPTREQMRRAGARSVGSLVDYTRLPAQMPVSIGREAHRVTDKMDTDYDKAIALQSYFNSGLFNYSEVAPVAEGFDGNGVDVLETFLDEKTGYCVHFSSAMAVMARTLGIPARIAVGYAPGTPTSTEADGKQVYEVSSQLLHSWPELHFDGIGWVSFEPTPGRGIETSFRSEFTSPAAPVGPADDSQLNTRRDLRSDAVTDAPSRSAAESPSAHGPAVIGAFALLLALGAPALTRLAKRRSRLRPNGSGAPIDGLWQELVDSASDYGITIGNADTARMVTGRLKARRNLDVLALERLQSRIERQRYARLPTDRRVEDVDDLKKVREGIVRGSTLWWRVRAVVVPASLFMRSGQEVRATGGAHSDSADLAPGARVLSTS